MVVQFIQRLRAEEERGLEIQMESVADVEFDSEPHEEVAEENRTEPHDAASQEHAAEEGGDTKPTLVFS